MKVSEWKWQVRKKQGRKKQKKEEINGAESGGPAEEERSGTADAAKERGETELRGAKKDQPEEASLHPFIIIKGEHLHFCHVCLSGALFDQLVISTKSGMEM